MRNKPRHELCMDKTSCKSELANESGNQRISSAEPTLETQTLSSNGQPTKNTIQNNKMEPK